MDLESDKLYLVLWNADWEADRAKGQLRFLNGVVHTKAGVDGMFTINFQSEHVRAGHVQELPALSGKMVLELLTKLGDNMRSSVLILDYLTPYESEDSLRSRALAQKMVDICPA